MKLGIYFDFDGTKKYIEEKIALSNHHLVSYKSTEITTNSNDYLHSFDNKPAVILRDRNEVIAEFYFCNGHGKHLNPEKYYIELNRIKFLEELD